MGRHYYFSPITPLNACLTSCTCICLHIIGVLGHC
jgi:hypothetical protein